MEGREVAGPGEKPGSLTLIQRSAPCLVKIPLCSLKWHRPLEPRGIYLPRDLGVASDSSHSKRGPKSSVNTFLHFTYEETEPQRGHRPPGASHLVVPEFPVSAVLLGPLPSLLLDGGNPLASGTLAQDPREVISLPVFQHWSAILLTLTLAGSARSISSGWLCHLLVLDQVPSPC